MSNPNYTLEVISHHPQFVNKSLRKYYVDGIDTVGAWGNEPFEIRFRNNTYQKVQVKISVDGTDVFTGEPATTDVGDKMWVVNGYDTMSLKAWPENNNGGAAFIFTSADNSVAIHTHGNMSSRGIIAAAVFTEGHVEPIRLNEQHHHYHYDYNWCPYTYIWPYSGTTTTTIVPTWASLQNQTTGTLGGLSGQVAVSNNSANVYTVQNCANSINSADYSAVGCLSFGETPMAAASEEKTGARCRSLQSQAAVGAGQHTDQHITYVAGLIKPVFTETVRVRYMWWDDLVEALRTRSAPAPHASGFPGDKESGINLKGTPRLGTPHPSKYIQPIFHRV